MVLGQLGRDQVTRRRPDHGRSWLLLSVDLQLRVAAAAHLFPVSSERDLIEKGQVIALDLTLSRILQLTEIFSLQTTTNTTGQ